jgi:hypothetical protein
LAPERRREAELAARHWVHRAVVCPRPEVCLEAASYRQPAACRERQAADRCAVMERLPEVHLPAVSSRRTAVWRGRLAGDRCAVRERPSARHPEVASL